VSGCFSLWRPYKPLERRSSRQRVYPDRAGGLVVSAVVGADLLEDYAGGYRTAAGYPLPGGQGLTYLPEGRGRPPVSGSRGRGRGRLSSRAGRADDGEHRVT
jgi:hypothetical protein